MSSEVGLTMFLQLYKDDSHWLEVLANAAVIDLLAISA